MKQKEEQIMNCFLGTRKAFKNGSTLNYSVMKR